MNDACRLGTLLWGYCVRVAAEAYLNGTLSLVLLRCPRVSTRGYEAGRSPFGDQRIAAAYVFLRVGILLCRDVTRYIGGWGRKNPERRLLFRIFYRSDPGEARTLDPMIKSHLLYQLSYGVRLFSISVAKVRIIFELASVFANFFR